jgi:formamidopyrimidine-DNA glycosylase
MPELPEVETVVRSLQAVLPGSSIVEVRLGKTNFIDDPVALARDLPGNKIVAVRRHGKFIVFDLENSLATARKVSLLAHLGMTGRFAATPAAADIPPHTHVFLALDDGRELRYTDIRRFGRMAVVEITEREKVLGELGADALEIGEKDFADLLKLRRARIKALLLDQAALRGMGNIYCDESLWRSRIHPARISANLSKDEVHRLHQAMRHVLKEAIRLKGSSISNYVYENGKKGEFQHRHKAYDREGEKCSRCGTLIRRTIVAGRSSCFCPKCQSPPRATKSRGKSLKTKKRK